MLKQSLHLLLHGSLEVLREETILVICGVCGGVLPSQILHLSQKSESELELTK